MGKIRYGSEIMGADEWKVVTSPHTVPDGMEAVRASYDLPNANEEQLTPADCPKE